MKKKIYRSRLSFDLSELTGQLAMEQTGIQIGLPAVSEEAKKKLLENFGLFGGSSDSNKFYDNIKSAADIMPKAEDFVEVPFRLLSAAIVGAGSWKATDFSNTTMLKASYKKLDGKPVYKNHDLEIDNWVGLVRGTTWRDAFTNNDGTPVPAGIDGILAIDAKTNPKVARGVLMGSIYSNSVTVEFDWEPSHTFEKEEDFLYKIGSYGSDGKMIRRVAKEVFNYHETSLVFLGADPFAKLLDDKGNLKGIDTSSIEYSKAPESEKTTYQTTGKIRIENCLDAGVVSFAKTEINNQKQNKPVTKPVEEPEMKKLMEAFAKKLALANGTELTEDQMIAELEKLSLTNADAPVLTAKAGILDKVVGGDVAVVTLKDDLTTEEIKVTLTEATADKPLALSVDVDGMRLVGKQTFDSLVEQAKTGQSFVKAQREEAIRLYKIAVGANNAKDAVINLFNTASVDALEGLLAQYGKESIKQFGGACKKCGSTEIGFRSSVGNENDDTTKLSIEPAKSFNDIYNDRSRGSMNIRRNNN